MWGTNIKSPGKPHLFAEDFDLILCQLLALVQLFDPSVQLLGE